MKLLVIVGALLTPVLSVAAMHFARAYCRVRSVEENRAGLWHAARPIGVLVGTVVWVTIRYATPEITPPTGDYPLWLNLFASAILSGAFLTVVDMLLEKLFIDEPSFGRARELFLEYGSDASGRDWIEVSHTDEEVAE